MKMPDKRIIYIQKFLSQCQWLHTPTFVIDNIRAKVQILKTKNFIDF